MMTCDVCGRRSDVFMVVGRSLGEDEEERSLCELCAAVAFPGLAEMIGDDCPVCKAASARWN